MSDTGTSPITLKRRLRRLRRAVSGSIRAAVDTLRGRDDSASLLNPLLVEVRKMATRDKVPRKIWRQVCQDMMAEAATVPGFDQVMERKTFIDNYMATLGERYHSHYL